jgi:DNA-binding response OmpR family regulator
VQEIRLAASEGDVVQLVREVTASFADLSEKKRIGLSFHSAVPALRLSFDPDKLERILFNLLSNAFKFTPEHGTVSVELLPVPAEKEGAEAWLDIRVQDTGIGIPKELQESIFERFFQHELPSHLMNQGSGIGLSITREFVRLHGGQLWVESEPDQGSTFTVRLPLRSGHHPSLLPDSQPEMEVLAPVPTNGEEAAFPKEKPKNALPTLLLVEDNEDFRFYLQDNLRRQYTILEAANGKEGWKRALSALPDLIVSDVAMPEMDGVELCRKVKADPRTTHIPVILLTARTQEEQQLEGIRTGASDYITKPFAFELLQARLKNLLVQRDTLHRSFQARPAITASAITVPSMDDKLLKKALAITETNLANPDFSVEELSREIGMSRVYLYKKLVAITGKTPIEFIRIVRLRRAAQLLEQSQLNISEIAYEVGFNSPRTFAKYFKQEYNVLPSDYQAHHGVGRNV